MTTVLWFRRDLRLHDHPALATASADDDVVGVFVLDESLWKPSGLPRRAFLTGCLAALDDSMGGRLLVLRGKPETLLPRVAEAVAAREVHVSEDFGPYGRSRDERVRDALADKDVEWHETGSAYAISPGRVTKPTGGHYSVFTPFFNAWSQHGYRGPAVSGKGVRWVRPQDVALGRAHRYDPRDLTPKLPKELSLPEPGEAAGTKRWHAFLANDVADYGTERDRPDHEGTSRLSPYLKWGCLHPRTLLADLGKHRNAGAAAYRRELAFREFYADLLLHAPESPRSSQDPAVDKMRWRTGSAADELFDAWREGRTGYPYIDAAMRQLLAEGWMHNRARMGVASFLIKDLHVPWQRGARHFMQHLVDGDVASNTFGWQWSAGAGAQAAPFYRIFNPIGQGEKWDPHGDYVRRWVPELRDVAGKAVHRPWELPDGLPTGYPERIVDHDVERRTALLDWEQRPAR
jgi:deoxyribodipyrimidine photo-lyase